MANSPASFCNHLLFALTGTVLLSACATPTVIEIPESVTPADLLIVDCLLPGQVRRLGSRITYLAPRRAVKTPASQCEIRGGEYVAYDRANAASSLKVWLPQAEQGDPAAQTYVGEIFEKGVGIEPDYQSAVHWYRKAVDQGHARAKINLGYLYETGFGVEQDLTTAMNLYREASGINDGTLEYVSSLEVAQRAAARRETQTLRNQIEELRQALQASEERYRKTRQRTRSDRQALDELRKQVEAKRREVRSLVDTPGSTPSESAQSLAAIESVRRELALAREDNARLEARLLANRDERQTLLLTIQQLENQGQAVPVATTRAFDRANRLDATLSNALAERDAAIEQLEQKQQEMRARYQRRIQELQASLQLSEAEQTRLAARLADTELTLSSSTDENQLLRERLRQQRKNVETREAEQLRLNAKLSSLAVTVNLSEQERRLAREAAASANTELVLARHEQTRLLTRLQESELRARAASLDAEQELAILERKLDSQTGIVESLQQRLSSLEESLTRERTTRQAPPVEQIAQLVTTGPSIRIIEPPVLLTRNPIEIPRQPDGTLSLIGSVTPAEELTSFSINGQGQALNHTGVFEFSTTAPVQQLDLVAEGRHGEKTAVAMHVLPALAENYPGPKTTGSAGTATAIDRSVFGNYHAIIIGNNEYQHLSSLQTAENDARAIERILREQYDFSTTLLLNADQLEILQALSTAQAKLNEQDNLIIYYAGHGQLDSEGVQGYWLPTDADAVDSSNWLSNALITSYLDSIPAKQIMVVADSCYSGTLTQASIPRSQEQVPSELRGRWLRLMAKRKVRTVLSSGGIKPVYDGTSKHSLFAKAFIQELQQNADVLEGYQLFSAVHRSVQESAAILGVEQSPQYAAVRHAGHEVGEFLLVSR